MSQQTLLRVADLHKTYRTKAGVVDAVRGVTFDLERGGSLGIVGESGSGKSTTARLILCLENPTSGRVLLNGRDVTELSRREMRASRRHMQLVFQDPLGSLNRRKTVAQIIASPLVAHRIGDRSERAARVHELIELVGLDVSFASRTPHELSGGQAQRVGIARALALKPELLILDEAVSALDVSIQAQILNLLRKLREELDLTYLFISHDLAVVKYMCESVVVLHRGRVVEDGPGAAIFHTPQHPYTIDLLAAAQRSRVGEPGPSPSDDTETVEWACTYFGTCTRERDPDRCRSETPTLLPAGDRQHAACHFVPSRSSVDIPQPNLEQR